MTRLRRGPRDERGPERSVQVSPGDPLGLYRRLSRSPRALARREHRPAARDVLGEGLETYRLRQVVVDGFDAALHEVGFVPETSALRALEIIFPPFTVGLGARPPFHRLEVSPIPAHSDVHREQAINDVVLEMKQYKPRLSGTVTGLGPFTGVTRIAGSGCDGKARFAEQVVADRTDKNKRLAPISPSEEPRPQYDPAHERRSAGVGACSGMLGGRASSRRAVDSSRIFDELRVRRGL
jgi:hypothetical protein